MDEHESELLRTQGLSFFGAVVAGQSHEATNVFNIINELVGLQTDILHSAEQGRPVNIPKLKQVAERIRNQVDRGETIIRCMNRFAHSVDCPVTVFDLKETLVQITYLAGRSANLQRTLLDQEFPEASMPLETSPFGLKQAVFNCIQIALDSSTQKRRVTVSYQVSDRGAEIAIVSDDPIRPGPNAARKQAFLPLLVQELGGKLVARPDAGDAHRFVLFFPRPSPARGSAAAGPGHAATEDSHAS